MKVEEKTGLIACTVLCGFLIAVFFHYINGVYWRMPYPRNTFLFLPEWKFSDFYALYPWIKTAGGPFSNHLSVYLPFAFAPLYLFYFFSAPATLDLIFILFSGFLLSVFFKKLGPIPVNTRWVFALILSFMTYPFLFCMDRANLEIFVFVFLALFLLERGRRSPIRSGFFLAGAVTMKIYPAVFALPLLKEKQYRTLLFFLLFSIVLLIFPAIAMPGGLTGTYAQLLENLSHFKSMYVLKDDGLRYSSNFLPVIVLFLEKVGLRDSIDPEMLLTIYFIAMLGVFILISAYIYFVEETYWKRVALLTFSIILLPQVSFDYRLIHLLLPTLFFLVHESSAEESKRDFLYCILFGLLLVPKAYYWIRSDISISVLLNPLLLTITSGVIIWDGLKVRYAKLLKGSVRV